MSENKSRRDFLKMSAATTAALGLGMVACQRQEKFVKANVPNNERIKVGVIGVGVRGKNILKAIQYVGLMKVVAICDNLDFQMKESRQYIDNEVGEYLDYNDLLAHKGLDAVVIATPLSVHHQVVMAALDKDLHILCEKALAYNIDQCKEIKMRGDQSNKLFQVSYQYQLNPVFNAIKNIIDNGYLGKLTRVECTWDRFGDWRRKVPSPDLERHLNWRLYKEYSGGLMAELASHQLNMVDNIIGEHPVKVVGTGGIDYWKDGRETFDNVHALFDYPSGVKVGFHSGTSNKHEGYQMKFYGDKGTIVSYGMARATIIPQGKAVSEEWKNNVDSITGASIKIIGKKSDERQIKPEKTDDIVYPTDNDNFNVTWRLYDNFAKAIKGKEKLMLGLHDGYQSAISVHMANDAIRNEKVVRWLDEYDV